MRSLREIHGQVARVRAFWRESPGDRLVKAGLSAEGATLLSMLESLPLDGVAVSPSLLRRLVKAGRDGFGHANAPDCDGCVALEEAEALLR